VVNEGVEELLRRAAKLTRDLRLLKKLDRAHNTHAINVTTAAARTLCDQMQSFAMAVPVLSNDRTLLRKARWALEDALIA
jgi:hypothetical protein